MILTKVSSILIAFSIYVYGQSNTTDGSPVYSSECISANTDCEADTECIHRLAVLQSACTTNTCQPQCKMAALNLFQNKLGRQLLRTDASCVPGKDELRKCGFLPNLEEKHCLLQKIVCETNMQCNAKWELFFSECEADSATGNCSDKCQQLYKAVASTKSGLGFNLCTCTDKDDQICEHIRDNVIGKCISMAAGKIPHNITNTPKLVPVIVPQPTITTQKPFVPNAIVNTNKEIESNVITSNLNSPTIGKPFKSLPKSAPSTAIISFSSLLLFFAVPLFF
uniref:GDNF domain-containing protein n=1 Tax=Rhabditophanes sp. KR3021 TaxID=114890 RepID=A0AC35U5N0_9BILA